MPIRYAVVRQMTTFVGLDVRGMRQFLVLPLFCGENNEKSFHTVARVFGPALDGMTPEMSGRLLALTAPRCPRDVLSGIRPFKRQRT